MEPGTYNLQIDTAASFRGFSGVAKDASGNPVPITGWTLIAEVRQRPRDPVLFDLRPVVTDGAAGAWSIPDRPVSDLVNLLSGTYTWDLKFQDTTGFRYPPTLTGRVQVSCSISGSTPS